MGRGMTIAVLCAAAVGTAGGGLLAVQLSPEASGAQPVARPAPANPAIVTQPITPDLHAALVVQIRTMLGAAAAWARAHAGEPCPDVAALGVTAIDPWGHAIELTCTDQPADQIMGVISAGPDGVRGNADDIESWHLGPTVTQLVQGRRWTTPSSDIPPVATKPASSKRRKASPHREPSAPTAASPPPAASQPASASTAPATPSLSPTDAGDGIPTRR
jgi:hypothetical protein